MRFYVSGCRGAVSETIIKWKEEKGYEIVMGAYCLKGSVLSESEIAGINMRLIEICDGIYMVRGWESDNIAVAELAFAKATGKKVHFESRQYNILKSLDKGGSE